jgi:mono/diheme cytochrome c family protein
MRVALFALVSLQLFACRSNPNSPARADGGPPELTSARPPESPTLKSRMHEHDKHGTAIRDAITRADLETARREAKILADLRVEGMDPPWRKKLDAMNEAAARVAQAKDLPEAGRDLAALATTCGDCHATMGGPAPAVGEPPGDGSNLALRMQRHQWAAARLWDGLVVPSDDAWKAGARVLVDAPLEPEGIMRNPPPNVVTLSRSVHELAKRAEVVGSAADRGGVYAELVSTCSACHKSLGGGPPAAKPR